jgi:DNA-binding IclR family transcriptional regulator
MRRPVIGPALAALGADQLGHLELHHLGRDGLDGLADHTACSSSSTFRTTSSIVILSAPATRRPLSSNLQQVRRS